MSINKKIIFLVSSLVLLTSASTSEMKEIYVEGYTTMVDLYEKIPVVLNVVQGDISKHMTLKIYMDGNLISNVKMLGKDINKQIFYLPSLDKENSKAMIRITINYSNYDYFTDSFGEFTYYSPAYDSVTNKDISDLVRLKSTNPVKVEFGVGRSSYTIKNVYETINIFGRSFDLNYSRIIDTSCFRISSKNFIHEINYCEFRVYNVFEGSNLLYKNNYMTTDLSVSKSNPIAYNVDFEYKYYVNNITGTINEQYYEGCDYELMPFFVPNNIKDKIIPYEVVFYDIGVNHSDYIYRNYFFQEEESQNKYFSYQYKLFDNNIKDINYE